MPVLRVAVREHVLEIVGERPQPALFDEQDGRGGHHLVLVVDELSQRVLEIRGRVR